MPAKTNKVGQRSPHAFLIVCNQDAHTAIRPSHVGRACPNLIVEMPLRTLCGVPACLAKGGKEKARQAIAFTATNTAL
jgi:hypothetical protein